MDNNDYLKAIATAIKDLSGDVKGMKKTLEGQAGRLKVLESKDKTIIPPRKPGDKPRHFHFQSHDGSKPPGSIEIPTPIGGWDIDGILKRRMEQRHFPSADGRPSVPTDRTIYFDRYKNSIAVFGHTMPYKGKLKGLGGSWNKTLRAWIFSKNNEKELEDNGFLSHHKTLERSE